MAARVRVVFMRARRTIRAVVIPVGILIVPAAFGRVVMAMGMVQGEHTATEPDDHAEHQEP